MSARSFLVRGLLAGLLAGIAAFVVAFTVGEPHVQAAIDVEEAASAHTHAGDTAAHSHEEDGTVVSRAHQRTWGLATGTLGIGTALGGLVALVAAGSAGRLGRLRPAGSTAVVALVGWVAVSLVPFLKYPASPPAVGDPDTIGQRTALFFAFLLVSVVAAVLAVALARRVWAQAGTYAAVVSGAAAYVAVMTVTAVVMPTVDELGDFPAGTLWSFREASLLTSATLWGVIGAVLVLLVGRLDRVDVARRERRAMAASL